MQQLDRKTFDFDTWAKAVRQQMLDSLAKRRNAPPQDTSTSSHRISADSDADS